MFNTNEQIVDTILVPLKKDYCFERRGKKKKLNKNKHHL